MTQTTEQISAQSTRFQETLRLPIDGLCVIAFSPDGRQVAVKRYADAAQRTLELAIYDVQSGAAQTVLLTAAGKCSPLDYAENNLAWQGQVLAATFEDGLYLWRTTNGTFEDAYRLETGIFALNLSANRLATVVLEKRVEGGILEPYPYLVLHDLTTGEEITRYSARKSIDGDLFLGISMLAWSPNGQQLLISDHYVSRTLTINGAEITEGELALKVGNRLQAFSWLDDATIMTVDRLSLLHTWNAADGEQQGEVFLKGSAAAFSPDRRWVVVGDEAANPNDDPEDVVKVFALPKAELVQRLPYELSSATEGRRALQLAFSADGTHLAAIIDESNPTLYVWAARQ